VNSLLWDNSEQSQHLTRTGLNIWILLVVTSNTKKRPWAILFLRTILITVYTTLHLRTQDTVIIVSLHAVVVCGIGGSSNIVTSIRLLYSLAFDRRQAVTLLHLLHSNKLPQLSTELKTIKRVGKKNIKP
jgi:hypothetical protein